MRGLVNKIVSRSLSVGGKWQQQQLRRLNIHEYQGAELMGKYGVNVPKGVAVSSLDEVKKAIQDVFPNESEKNSTGANGLLFARSKNIKSSCFSRSFASTTSKQPGKQQNQAKKEVTTVDDPFDSITYNIPEQPVTFTEGASYSLVILAGLGVAGAAGYAVFKELIFQPKEYRVFDKALKRIQDDAQVRVRIGSPIKGYGQETRNRAARQRIPNRVFTDEDGVEHVEVNFYIRGPQGAGKVYTEMFRDKANNEWKYTYLIVEILTPSPAKLMLESYLPA